MDDGELPTRFTREGWFKAGYSGFKPLLTLNVDNVPTGGGVNAVLRPNDDDSQVFLEKSRGGHFKGKDPTVEVDVLQQRWVAGVATLNIGKADALRRRLKEYRDYGNGRPVGHQGGRYIWQLADACDLIVCWSVTIANPRDVERALIAEFASVYGCRPFANLVG